MRPGATCAIALGLLAAASLARADLPGVIARGQAGPFPVTVLAELPLRAGSSSWLVWLGDEAALPETRIEIEVDGMRGAGVAPGPVAVHLHRAGPATAVVRVEREGRHGELRFELEVAPRPGLLSHWRALSIAPLGLLLLGAHQWRRVAGSRARIESYRL